VGSFRCTHNHSQLHLRTVSCLRRPGARTLPEVREMRIGPVRDHDRGLLLSQPGDVLENCLTPLGLQVRDPAPRRDPREEAGRVERLRVGGPGVLEVPEELGALELRLPSSRAGRGRRRRLACAARRSCGSPQATASSRWSTSACWTAARPLRLQPARARSRRSRTLRHIRRRRACSTTTLTASDSLRGCAACPACVSRWGPDSRSESTSFPCGRARGRSAMRSRAAR
jgi:hypothetical protein